MNDKPGMTFDEWWNEVARPAMFANQATNEASAFIQSVAKSAAEKAWIFSRVAYVEEQSRKLREAERVWRESEKRTH